MKKLSYLLFIMLIGLVVMPKVNAGVVATTFKEAVQEEIEVFSSDEYKQYDYIQEYVKTLRKADFTNYTDDSNKVNVYLFRGASCPHCVEEIVWFTTQIKEYGNKFNLVTYEVWNNSDNNKLMNKVASTLGDNPSGVPYTVIGNQSFSGFMEGSTDTQMLEKIKSEYDAAEKYNVMDHINETSEEKDNTLVTVILTLLVLAGGIALIYYVSKSN